MGGDLFVYPTKSLEDLGSACAMYYRKNNNVIIMGGDGSFSKGVHAIAQDNNFKPLSRPIGLILNGTGNSYLRHFHIKSTRQSLEYLIKGIKTGKSLVSDSGLLTIDNGSGVKKLVFINFIGFGLVPEISRLGKKMYCFGKLSYILAALVKLATHKPYTFTIQFRQKIRTILADFIFIANTSYAGGAMKVAPGVQANDGRLMLLFPQIYNRIRLFALFPKIFSGKHIQNTRVKQEMIQELAFKTDAEIVMDIDGDQISGINPSIKVIPGMFRFYFGEL